MSEPFGTDRDDYVARRYVEVETLIYSATQEDFFETVLPAVKGSRYGTLERDGQVAQAVERLAAKEFVRKEHIADIDLLDVLKTSIENAEAIKEGRVEGVLSMFDRKKEESVTPENAIDPTPSNTISETQVAGSYRVKMTLALGKSKGMLTVRGLDIVGEIKRTPLNYRRVCEQIRKGLFENTDIDEFTVETLIDQILRIAAEKVVRKEENENGEQRYTGLELIRELNSALMTVEYNQQVPEPEEMPLDDTIYFGWGNRYTEQARNILNALDASDRKTLINAAIPKVRYMNEIPSWMREDDCIAYTADMLLLQAAEMLLKERDNGVVIEDSDIPNKLEDTITKGKFEHKPTQIGIPG
jgi:hypothetical protein